MNKRVINALLLSATLGWVVPVMAQDSSLESHLLFGKQTEIYPASIPRKMLWALTALIAPDEVYRQIPLYTYQGLDNDILKELDNDILNNILSEVANGNVHIAVVTDLSSNYPLAHGIQISGNVEWSDIKNEIGDKKVWALALTRPLAPNIIDNLNNIDNLNIIKSEYITSPKLWQNPDKKSAE